MGPGSGLRTRLGEEKLIKIRMIFTVVMILIVHVYIHYVHVLLSPAHNLPTTGSYWARVYHHQFCISYLNIVS
jgi:hypothetical protein